MFFSTRLLWKIPAMEGSLNKLPISWWLTEVHTVRFLDSEQENCSVYVFLSVLQQPLNVPSPVRPPHSWKEEMERPWLRDKPVLSGPQLQILSTSVSDHSCACTDCMHKCSWHRGTHSGPFYMPNLSCHGHVILGSLSLVHSALSTGLSCLLPHTHLFPTLPYSCPHLPFQAFFPKSTICSKSPLETCFRVCKDNRHLTFQSLPYHTVQTWSSLSPFDGQTWPNESVILTNASCRLSHGISTWNIRASPGLNAKGEIVH